jgi:hypothetical protein
MLSGKKKKDYAAESAANALETQAEVLGMAAAESDSDEDDEDATAEVEEVAAETEHELVAA